MKYLLLHRIILLCSLFCIYSSYAQNAHPAFHPYTVEDGLPSSEVYQVKEDSKGYIWFATGNGVSRFNGYEFENFSMSNGLPDNTVFEIYEDNAERIWFVPISCKLSYYQNGKIHQFKFNSELQKLLSNPIKSSFAVDKKGTVFLGVIRDGIYEISQDGKITHHFGKDDLEVGLNIIEPDSNSLIYSTNSKDLSKKIRFKTEEIKAVLTIPDYINEIGGSLRVIKNRKNQTLMSCLNKVYVFKNENEYSIRSFPKRVIWIYEDTEGDIWLGTYLGGVYHIHGGDFDDVDSYLNDLSVNGVWQDREGGYWFATEGNGVFYAKSKKVLIYDENNGLGNNKVNCITTDGNSVFVGTQNGWVQKIKDSVIVSFDINKKNERTNNISALFYDSIKKKLLVSGKPLCGYIQNNRFSETISFRTFNRIIIDDDQSYWRATSMSLDHIVDGKIVASGKRTQQLKRINGLVKSRNNTFLLGTVDGLWEFNLANEAFNYLGGKDSLLSNRILDLTYLNNEALVIATKGKGVLIYDNDYRVSQIDSRKGLCGDNVYRVISNGSDIWAATNKGVNKITVKQKSPLIYDIQSYTISDGLSSNEINDILVLNGKTWAATNKGINIFDGSMPLNSPASIPLYIENIAINDSILPLKNNYELDYDQNNININFIGLSYKNAGKLQYKYRMNGLDTTWAYTQNREIRFTTLPPNNYLFELCVLDSNGECKGMIMTSFLIRPPFWQKWWFIALICLTCTLLIFQFLRYRISLVREREHKNSELNKTLLNLKLKALRAQMNPHFTFNVMNSIQHFILNKDDESAHRYLSKFSKLIRTVLHNSEDNTIPLAEEIKALELYIQLEAMRFEHSFQYEIIIDKAIDPAKVGIPSMLIQPYVENAIKHGILPLKENGKIKIEIIKQDSLLKCIIEDNGIGRKKAGEQNKIKEHKSMGISLTQERLSVINAINSSNLSERIIDLTDRSGNVCGTKVEIYIPVN